MPQILLEEYESPIVESIWKLDIQFDKIPQWMSHFDRYSNMGNTDVAKCDVNRFHTDGNQ